MITLRDVLDYNFEELELMAQTSYIYGYGKGRLFNHSTLYTFLDTINLSLCAVTIALRKHPKKGLCIKPICVHDLETGKAFVKNLMEGGGMFQRYTVDWCKEGITKKTYSYYGYKYDKNRITSWEEVYIDADKKQQNFNFTDTISNPEYLQNTKYKYCGWTKGLFYNLNEFIQLYNVYPQIEYFAKMRKMHLAIPSILNLCSKDKNFIKFLRNTAIPEVTADWRLKPVDIIQAYRNHTSVRVQFNIRDLRRSLKPFKQISRTMWAKIKNYVEKKGVDSTMYYDYLVSVIALDLDLNDSKNLTPIDFQRWHDIRIAELADKQAKGNAKILVLKNQGIKEVATRYSKLVMDEEFYIYMPTSVKEFVDEGDALHHCVGRLGYADRMSRGDTLIFFIRDPHNKNLPYVTMEYSPSRQIVVQIYGDHDSKPSQDVVDFVNVKWKPIADKEAQKIQRKLLKESA